METVLVENNNHNLKLINMNEVPDQIKAECKCENCNCKNN
jgi:hypothetical protein